MGTILTAAAVQHIYADCLPRPEEKGYTLLVAEGIQNMAGFVPRRIYEHKDQVRAMLMELPDEFMDSVGGGWSFMNACNDRHGDQWADLHATMEKLVMLGIALNMVSLLFPRAVWALLPGGVPYFVVRDNHMEAK